MARATIKNSTIFNDNGFGTLTFTRSNEKIAFVKRVTTRTEFFAVPAETVAALTVKRGGKVDGFRPSFGVPVANTESAQYERVTVKESSTGGQAAVIRGALDKLDEKQRAELFNMDKQRKAYAASANAIALERAAAKAGLTVDQLRALCAE